MGSSESGISIIDLQDFSDHDTDIVRMMTAACLFTREVSASCYTASLIDLIFTYDTISETRRFKIYTNLMRANPKNNEEILQQVEKQFETYLTLRKLKNKSQPHIVLLKRVEADIYARFKTCKEYYQEVAANMGLAPLMPLATNERNNQEKPLFVYWIPPNNSPEHAQAIIKLFSGTLSDWQWLPMLRSEAVLSAPCFSFTDSHLAGPGAVLCEPLFEFPEPLELNAAQLPLVRNALSTVAGNFMDRLAYLNRELMNISFEPDNFSSLHTLYTEKVQPLTANMQQTISNNHTLSALQNHPGKVLCKIWMGITAARTLFGFYRQQEIIDASSEAYSIEQAATRLPPGNARLFLFFETINSENHG